MSMLIQNVHECISIHAYKTTCQQTNQKSRFKYKTKPINQRPNMGFLKKGELLYVAPWSGNDHLDLTFS